MEYVLSACADQAEAINASLPGNCYHYQDVLPDGKDMLSENNTRRALADGTKLEIGKFAGRLSHAYDIIEKVVWDGPSTPFGPIVRANLHKQMVY